MPFVFWEVGVMKMIAIVQSDGMFLGGLMSFDLANIYSVLHRLFSNINMDYYQLLCLSPLIQTAEKIL